MIYNKGPGEKKNKKTKHYEEFMDRPKNGVRIK